jgi:hypothetical protein
VSPEPRSIPIDRREKWSVRLASDALAPLLRDRGAQALPKQTCVLWGEVLSVADRRSRRFVVLEDAYRDGATLRASLPLGAGPRPRVGDMVGLHGVFEGTPTGLAFRAETVERRGPSARRRRREAELRNLTSGPRSTLQGAPEIVRVVTSASCEALPDFVAALAGALRTPPECIDVSLERPDDIARGIRRAEHLGSDLIVVTRGGGSPGDLSPFDDLDLLRTIADVTRRTPVLVAIGHQRNHPAAERVASYVAATPSAAGQLVREKLELARRSAARERPEASPPKPPRRNPLSVFTRWAGALLRRALRTPS